MSDASDAERAVEPAPMSDAERLESMLKLEAFFFTALDRRLFKCVLTAGEETLTLGTLAWLDIIQEVRDRHPRNFSRLIADDTQRRLEAAIDRIHEEANYLIAMGPGSIAERHSATKRTPRQVASAVLRESPLTRREP